MEKGGDYEGYCKDLVKLLNESLPYNFEMRLVRDGMYGAEMPDGEWNGMIGELTRKVSRVLIPLTPAVAIGVQL